MAGQYYGFVLQFIASIILARYFISPEELGLFSIAFSAISLLAFLQDFGVARYVSGEKDLTEEKRQMAFSISMAISWAIAAGCVGLAWPIADYFGDAELVTISLIIASSYFLVPFAIVPQALRQREMDFKTTALINFGSANANALVALYLGWQGYGAAALAWGAFGQQAARALVAQWRIGWMMPWPMRFSDCGRLFAFGGTNTVLVMCTMISDRAPELFIGRIFGAAPVGLFARGASLAMQLRMLLFGAVSGVFYPAFRKFRDEGKSLAAPYVLVAGTFTAIMWPAFAGLAVLSEPVVLLLYGEKWIETAPLLFWLAVSQMGFMAVPLAADMAILLDQKKDIVVRHVLDLALAIAVLIAAIPYGVEAVAASRLVHSLMYVANFGQILRRIVGFTWVAWLTIHLRSAFVTALAVAPTLIFYRIWDKPHEAGLLQILASAACGAALWIVGLWVVRHPFVEEVKPQLADLIQRVRPTDIRRDPIR